MAYDNYLKQNLAMRNSESLTTRFEAQEGEYKI